MIVAKKLSEISFRDLMEIYREGNTENGIDFYPNETRERQLMLAEQDFYHYLCEVFFKTEEATYLIWTEGGCYVSALRLEPYQDGLLLEGLETAPGRRRMGFGKKLMQVATEQFGNQKIYSHVNKKNIPSRRIHEACGFRILLDHAVYADGSVLQNSVTYVYP